MEGGALLEDAFVEFSKNYVLFCHITSRIKDAKYDDLLGVKGGKGFPYIVFLDAKGDIAGKHNGDRTAAAFTETGDKVRSLPELLKKAAKGDKVAANDAALVKTDLELLDVDGLRKEFSDRDATPEQKKRFEGILTNTEVQKIMDDARKTKSKTMGVDCGKKYSEMKKAGRIPSGGNQAKMFWHCILDYAESVKDAKEYEEALVIMRKWYEGNAQMKPFMEKAEATLLKMKEPAAK